MKNNFILIICMALSINATASENLELPICIDNSSQTAAWTTDALIETRTSMNEYNMEEMLYEIIEDALDKHLAQEIQNYALDWHERKENFIKNIPNCCRKGWCENIEGENCYQATIAMPYRLGCLLNFPCFYSRYINMKNQQTLEHYGQLECLDIHCDNNIGEIDCCTAIMLMPCGVACIPCLYTDFIFMKTQEIYRYDEFYQWN